jgi:magnesium-transporting ATPase (P-type)
MICIASLILFSIVWLLHVMFSDQKLVDDISIKRAIDLACTVAALLAVCIPEGMPLVISMAMAFSVQSLKKENLLIKNLDALETSGQLVDVVTGKTATLTEGEMKVEMIHSQGLVFNVAANRLEMTQNVLNDLKQAIILNSDAHMQMDKTDYKPKGSPLEVGLLDFVSEQGVAVHDKFLERENESKYELKAWIPFSSERKVMTVAYINKQEDENIVRVVQKGAPEYVLQNCERWIDQTGEESNSGIDREETLASIERDVIMAREGEQAMGLKAITFGTKIMDASEFFPGQDFESDENRALLESNLTYVATLGLSDPLRENVALSIEKLNTTKTNVRLMSGDHKLAVVATAIQLGMKDDEDDFDDCMEGNELLELLKNNMEV